MTTFQAGHIDRGETVLVWDGSWLPATVADMVLEPGGECLIVRCENGASAPASFADLDPRDPNALGTDKPLQSRARTMTTVGSHYALTTSEVQGPSNCGTSVHRCRCGPLRSADFRAAQQVSKPKRYMQPCIKRGGGVQKNGMRSIATTGWLAHTGARISVLKWKSRVRLRAPLEPRRFVDLLRERRSHNGQKR